MMVVITIAFIVNRPPNLPHKLDHTHSINATALIILHSMMEIARDSIIFWAILEQDTNTIVQDYIKNAFSFEGFGKALVFQDISNDDICLVEEYVSNKLPERLETLLTESQIKYTHKEKICFFGSYASVPAKFCFAPGERKMILKMVMTVKETVEKEGLQHYADESAIPKKQFSRINMFESVFGLIYGFQEKPKIEKVSDLTINTTHLQNILFEKAKCMFDQFLKKKLVPAQSEFTIDMVQVKTEGEKIKGKVQCIFCEADNAISVFRKSSGNWVLTNLTCHINGQHVKNKEQTKKETDKLAKQYEEMSLNHEKKNDTKTAVSKSEPLKDSDEMSSTEDSKQNVMCEDTLYTQISAQCIKMENSVAHNGEKTLSKCFNLQPASTRDIRTVKYCRIPGDGDCLFSAISHQLYNVKVGSSDHKREALNLRSKVVSYIKEDEHFPNFIHDLKNRIACDGLAEPDDIEKACKEFLNDQLSMPRCWGGMESIKAISEMQKLHIVVMNDNGTCNLPNKFNKDNGKTLLLLFGSVSGKTCKNNDERSHYDSITHISQEKITTIAKELSEAEMKHENFLKDANSNNVIEID